MATTADGTPIYTQNQINQVLDTGTNLSTVTTGTVPAAISNLGSDAVASFNAGLSSLSSGAVGFNTSTLADIQAATGNAVSQLTGLASGLTGGNVASAVSSITTAVNADIGALIANGSKYGDAATVLWAQKENLISDVGNNINNAVGGLSTAALNAAANLADSATDAVTGLAGSVTSSLNDLGKSVQSAINFADNALSVLVSGVQPAAGFTNTVNRATLDAAVVRVIGADKISPPTYEIPSAESLGIAADIAQAKAFLAQAQSAVSETIGQGQALIGQAQATASGLVNQAQSSVKNLFG
jgi:hypothetical protein